MTKQTKGITGILLVAVVLLLCGCASDRPVMETGTIVSSEESEEALPMAVLTEEAFHEETEDPVLPEIEEETSRCIVQVHAGNQDGCGVICRANEESLLIATVAHIFPVTDVLYQVTVTFPDGESYPATETIHDAARDVAILQVDAKTVPGGSYRVATVWGDESVEQENTDATAPSENEEGKQDTAQEADTEETDAVALYAAYDGYHTIEVILLDTAFRLEEDAPGFPKGNVILAAGQAERGMSGGGLFDSSGNLLGILAGGTTEGHLVAVPLATYETYLRKFE